MSDIYFILENKHGEVEESCNVGKQVQHQTKLKNGDVLLLRRKEEVQKLQEFLQEALSLNEMGLEEMARREDVREALK